MGGIKKKGGSFLKKKKKILFLYRLIYVLIAEQLFNFSLCLSFGFWNLLRGQDIIVS